jgi:hypothetical protein
MVGIPPSNRDRVLDLWSEGRSGREITAELGCGTRFDVAAIVRMARDAGDPRAAPHFGRGTRPQAAEEELFSRAQYLRMDRAFKARLMRAIRRNQEHAPIGVYQTSLPARAVPLRLQPEPSVSVTGSSAGECADIGAMVSNA